METPAFQYFPVVAKSFAAGRFFSVVEMSSARSNFQDFSFNERFFHYEYEQDCGRVGFCGGHDYG